VGGWGVGGWAGMGAEWVEGRRRWHRTSGCQCCMVGWLAQPFRHVPALATCQLPAYGTFLSTDWLDPLPRPPRPRPPAPWFPAPAPTHLLPQVRLCAGQF